jgi:uncharacterized protein with PIN domain
MHDDDPPQCPKCDRPLWKTRKKVKVRSDLGEDWDAIYAVVYECKTCRFLWEDRLDGSPLEIAGPVRKKPT